MLKQLFATLTLAGLLLAPAAFGSNKVKRAPVRSNRPNIYRKGNRRYARAHSRRPVQRHQRTGTPAQAPR